MPRPAANQRGKSLFERHHLLFLHRATRDADIKPVGGESLGIAI
jgi:hypothetical protein